jgi:methionyl-tRNA formyltransferase
MRITLLTDNPESWYVPFGRILCERLRHAGHETAYVFRKEELPHGDICFLLSCSKIVEKLYLQRHRHNIVVHASDLPQGKGFAPLQWQILAGKDVIPLTLFEAVEEVDAGPYYLKSTIRFDGTELYDELRAKLAEKINAMCFEFVEHVGELVPIPQTGAESFFRRRTRNDDELSVERSIAEQFNHFRVADNEKFPLFFRYRGRKYYLKIYRAED